MSGRTGRIIGLLLLGAVIGFLAALLIPRTKPRPAHRGFGF